MAQNKNKIKISPAERAFDIFNVLFMFFLCIIMIYPFFYVVVASISEPAKLMAHDGLLLAPQGLSGGAYSSVLKNPRVWTGYGNTIFYVIVGTTFNIIMTVLCAYGLSRKGLMFNRIVTIMVVFTMYFSGGMVPSFLVVRGLGLYNSRLALIIPGAISTFNMIIMRTAMAGVPDSLEESARLEGASHLQVLFKIMIPVTMPTIAVLILYYGVGHWNSWFSASIYLKDPSKYPLQLYLRQILIQSQMSDMNQASASEDQALLAETIKYATIIVATVPILVLYPFLQKYFVKGVMAGSLKG